MSSVIFRQPLLDEYCEMVFLFREACRVAWVMYTPICAHLVSCILPMPVLVLVRPWFVSRTSASECLYNFFNDAQMTLREVYNTLSRRFCNGR